MFIERIDMFPLVHKLEMPYGDANGYKKYRSCFMVRLTTSSGIEGWGECIDWLPTLIKGFEERFIPFLLGKKITDHNQIVKAIGKWHQRSAAAISMALTEILAKQAGIHICELWGGKLHNRVPVYASFQSYSNQDTWIKHSIDLVTKAVEDGYHMVKVKVGGKKLQEDQAHIQRLQTQVGQGIGIAIDANESYDAVTAYRWEKLFQQWDNMLWFEEPLPLSQVSEYKSLRDSLSIPLAGGENLKDPGLFLQFLSNGALDILQPDVMHFKGLEPFRDTARLSRYYGVRCSPHCFDGILSRIYALFTQACLLPWSKMDGDAIEPIEWDAMENPFTSLSTLQPDKGEVLIPTGKGLGIELDIEKMKAFLWDGSRYW